MPLVRGLQTNGRPTTLPHVEASFAPEDENGFAIEEVQDKVLDNIKHLHLHSKEGASRW